MRRRQIYERQSSAPFTTVIPVDDTPPQTSEGVELFTMKSPETSRSGDTAPAAEIDLTPQPVADDVSFEISPVGETLRYQGNGGSIVMLRAAPTGLTMWNGSQWVPAHVVPSKRSRDG